MWWVQDWPRNGWSRDVRRPDEDCDYWRHSGGQDLHDNALHSRHVQTELPQYNRSVTVPSERLSALV